MSRIALYYVEAMVIVAFVLMLAAFVEHWWLKRRGR